MFGRAIHLFGRTIHLFGRTVCQYNYPTRSHRCRLPGNRQKLWLFGIFIP